jgi:hypothetical protein
MIQAYHPDDISKLEREEEESRRGEGIHQLE